MSTDLDAVKANLTQRGKALLSDLDGYITGGLVYWGLKRSLLGEWSEQLDVLEEKVPTIMLLREFYAKWEQWVAECLGFMRRARVNLDDIRQFNTSVQSARRLFGRPGSPFTDIRIKVQEQESVIEGLVLTRAVTRTQSRRSTSGSGLGRMVDAINENKWYKLTAIIATILGLALAIIALLHI